MSKDPAWRANRAEQAKRYRERSPEKSRAAHKRWYEKAKANPEAWRAYLDRCRMNHYLRRQKRDGVDPEEMRRVHRPNNGRNGVDALPIEPFREWAERRMANMHWGLTEFAEACGMTERTMRRVLYEQQSVTLGLADRALLNEGSAFLWELWPELRS